jgi:segregation and condensation protein B
VAEVSVKNIVEAALMAAGDPLPLSGLQALFAASGQPSRDELLEALEALRGDYAPRGIELVEVASGYRVQVRESMAPWIGRLWDDKPARYSRALLETLALVAYRQPITRGEIEDVRGVAVSTNIMRTLLERNWVRIVGHRDVPGRPALFATTKAFLDYFGLKGLSDLPSLAEVKSLAEPTLLEADDPESSGDDPGSDTEFAEPEQWLEEADRETNPASS